MGEQRVGTIHLSGEAAVQFANCLFRPDQDAIRNHNDRMDMINDRITIHENGNGFSADISDLDLSFLEEGIQKEPLEFQVSIRIKDSRNIYFSCRDIDPSTVQRITEKIVCPAEQTVYSEAASDSSLSIAA